MSVVNPNSAPSYLDGILNFGAAVTVEQDGTEVTGSPVEKLNFTGGGTIIYTPPSEGEDFGMMSIPVGDLSAPWSAAGNIGSDEVKPSEFYPSTGIEFISPGGAPADGQPLGIQVSSSVIGQNWKTLVDIDFTAQTNQTFDTDGNYTIGGITFTKVLTADEYNSNHPKIINGTGLQFCPTTGTNRGISAAPSMRIPFSQFAALTDFTIPLRITFSLGAVSAASQAYGAVQVDYYSTSNTTRFVTVDASSLNSTGTGSSYDLVNVARVVAGSSTAEVDAQTWSDHNAQVIQLPRGFAPVSTQLVSAGSSTTIFSGVGNATLYLNDPGTAIDSDFLAGVQDTATLGQASQWGLTLYSNSSSNSGSYYVIFTRIKIEALY